MLSIENYALNSKPTDANQDGTKINEWDKNYNVEEHFGKHYRIELRVSCRDRWCAKRLAYLFNNWLNVKQIFGKHCNVYSSGWIEKSMVCEIPNFQMFLARMACELCDPEYHASEDAEMTEIDMWVSHHFDAIDRKPKHTYMNGSFCILLLCLLLLINHHILSNVRYVCFAVIATLFTREKHAGLKSTSTVPYHTLAFIDDDQNIQNYFNGYMEKYVATISWFERIGHFEMPKQKLKFKFAVSRTLLGSDNAPKNKLGFKGSGSGNRYGFNKSQARYLKYVLIQSEEFLFETGELIDAWKKEDTWWKNLTSDEKKATHGMNYVLSVWTLK